MARGRPLSFDKANMLEKTLHTFWQSGYLGTSYTDICMATGLSKPSLYAAFGNKEEMFLAALELYLDRHVRPAVVALANEADPREGIRKLLVGTADGLTSEGTPLGCMIASNIACAVAPEIPQPVADTLRKAARETPDAIRRRLQAASPQELPSGASPASLALFFEALISGLSGLARQGSSRADLLVVVDVAMLCWPCHPPQ
ncbi:MAG: TetR/AcrR family transcriptional regulator [Pseudorhodobacter sp.]